jgi:two-component system response regulator AtoC
MVVLNRGKEISQYDLDPRFTLTTTTTDSRADLAPNNLSMEENEKRLLRNALHEARGNRTKAAELMGISRRTLHRKLDRWPELDTR